MYIKHLPLFLILCFILSCDNEQQNTTPINNGDIVLEEITIDQIQQAYQNGSYSIQELVQAYLNRIEAIDKNGPQLNAIIEVNPDALEIAAQLDQEMKDGNIRGPMHGIPVILKDNIDTHDKMMTTAGSRMMIGSKPLQDSWVAKTLRQSGAVILGKSNLSEWANLHSSFSSSGWSGRGGQTNNPYDTSRNPCGSSSGSGVAVAANLCVVAIGTETNGSIVCPSNNNGIVGIKPTVGLLSRSGIIPISFSQDTPGPMARTVKDAAICLGVMTGIDTSDNKTLNSEGHSHRDYTQFLKADGIRGKRLGLYKRPMGRHYRVDSLMNRAVNFLKEQGAEIIEIERISQENIDGPSFQVLLYEFKDGLNKYFASLGPSAPVNSLEDLIEKTFADSIEMQYFNHETLRNAQKKGDLNSKEYLDALAFLDKHSRKEGLDKVMQENNLDAIITPTGGPAWKTDLLNGDNFSPGVFSSSPAAIAGYPSITLPMGFIEGLPVGMSIFGSAWSEPLLLEIAYAYEQGTQYRKPPVLD